MSLIRGESYLKASKDLRNATLGAFSAGIAKFANACIGLLASVVLVQGLSQDNYAIYKQIGALTFLFAVFTSFSLEQILSRYLPEYISKKKWTAVLQLIAGVMLIRVLLLAFVLAVVGSFLRESFFSFFNLPDVIGQWYSVIAFIIAFSLACNLFGRAFFTAFLEQIKVSIIDVTESLLMLAATAVSLLVLRAGISGIILSMLLTRSVTFLVYIVLFISRIIRIHRESKAENGGGGGVLRDEFKRMFRFGAVRTCSQQISFLKSVNVDVLAVSHYLPLVEVSLYGFAQIIAGLFMRFSPANMLNPIVQPLVIKRYYADSNYDVLAFSFSFLHKVNMFILMPLLGAVLVFSDKVLIHLFKPEYLGSLPVIWVLSVCFFVRSFIYPYDPYIRILEKNKVVFVSSFLAFYNVAMYVILIPPFGIVGAAIATGSAGVFTLLVFWAMLRFYERIRPALPLLAFGKIILNTLLMCAVLLALRTWANSTLGVCSSILIASVVYLFASYFNKIFSEQDRLMLNHAIGRKVWVF